MTKNRLAFYPKIILNDLIYKSSHLRYFTYIPNIIRSVPNVAEGNQSQKQKREALKSFSIFILVFIFQHREIRLIPASRYVMIFYCPDHSTTWFMSMGAI